MNFTQFEKRKQQHIHEALNMAHQAVSLTDLDRVHLAHHPLPELNWDELSLESKLFGKTSKTPFFVSGMTAGHQQARFINETIAKACVQKNWSMGVGSQRRELHDLSDHCDQWKKFRKNFPSLKLYSNLGLSQLITTPFHLIQKMIEQLQPNALIIHTNPLQESLQHEGTPQFKKAALGLAELCKKLKIPVVLKETGCGFSIPGLQKLKKQTMLSAIDVSGLGGTHWGRIEGARNPKGSYKSEAATVFASWGESTVQSVLNVKKVFPRMEIWASGGVRSGLDAAKLIALGASQVGYAQPVLQLIKNSKEKQVVNDLVTWMESQEFQLKVALFCTGCVSPNVLRRKQNIWKITTA